MAERWLPVAGFVGHYEVSDMGRVRSLKYGKKKVLKPINNGFGYLYVYMVTPKKVRRVAIHRLVLETFVGPCPPGMECCHYPDADTKNCKLSNLSWGTAKQNWKHRDEIGHHYRGEKTVLAKLTEKQVREIYALRASGLSCNEIAKTYGVVRRTVGHICEGHSWAHLGLVPLRAVARSAFMAAE